ncbi:MAG TPA: hypothetical protein VN577_12485 [Terriglobales bacterium]|nr:hypothetical protein [Terriglobales bacterium]
MTSVARDEFKDGIRRYMNAQREVVLEVGVVSLKEIWAWGGSSSPIEDLAEIFFQAKTSSEQLNWIK